MSLRCDMIIRDVTVLDGTGAPRFTADVAVQGDRILSVGDLSGMSAEQEVIGTGKALAPGFIDAHTHDDRAVLCGPECMTCKLSQGVTTVVVGNCGISLAPARFSTRPIPPLDLLGDESWWTFDSFGDYAHQIAKQGVEVNTYAMVGHQTLRARVMKNDVERVATDAEIAEMAKLLDESLAQGASGFSTGLYYRPNASATEEEVIATASSLAAHGGIYVTHMRDEGDDVMESIQETLRIGRGADVPVVISHHKCTMPENFGRSRDTLALIDRLGQDQAVAFDVYPYPAGSTVLMPWRIRQDVKVKVTWSIPHPEMAGKDLREVAEIWGLGEKETAEKLLPAGAIYFQMDEADVQRIMVHPRSMFGSDGLPHDSWPHPRLWGTFPRILGQYVRDIGLLSLESAVHKMTGRTAHVFGIKDRGVIRAGAYADLVLFDPEGVKDNATYDNPTAISEGIETVWANGVATWQAGAVTGEKPGRLVTRGK